MLFFCVNLAFFYFLVYGEGEWTPLQGAPSALRSGKRLRRQAFGHTVCTHLVRIHTRCLFLK